MNFKLQIILNLLSLKYNKKLYKSDLKKLQAKRWAKMQFTLQQSPFYEDFTNRKQELKHYPIINKSIFMERFDSINTRGVKRNEAFDLAIKAEKSRDFESMIDGVTIGLSSGTSGNRGVFLATETERAQWVACVLDRIIGFSLKKRSVAFFLRANSNLYDSVKSLVLTFEFFDLLEDLETQIQKLNKVNPTVLVAQPSLLIELAKKQGAGELHIHPQKIISVAEVLYPEDARYLETVFKQTIHQVYQCTEGLLAATCAHGTLHFNDDFLIIEKKYIDGDKTRFHPIITDLMRTTQPVIRYELNDIIHEKKNCPCGSKSLAIEQIEGRSDDVLVFESNDGYLNKIFPDFFRRAIIMSNASINDYTLVQSDKNELNLFIDADIEIYEQAKASIIDLLKAKNINNITIHRSEIRQHEKGNKLRRIRNDYRKAN
ncbi:MAG: hypothetical protein QNL61_00910 [Crocinitomicaceae bacterium]